MARVLMYAGHGFLPMVAFQRGIRTVSTLPLVLRGASTYGANDYESCTVGIMFGMKEPLNRMLPDQRAHDTHVLIIDLGYLKRGTVAEARQNPEEVYWSVNLNGLNGWGDPPPSPMPSDRWKSLGLSMARWQDPTEGHFLVCGQKPHDAALGGVQPGQWLVETVSRLRSLTNKQIVWRPHPDDHSSRRLHMAAETGVRQSKGNLLAEDLKGCAGLIAYNSNSLVEALLAGVPIYPLGPGSVCPTMGHAALTVETIKNPLRPERNQFFYDLAYRQWNIPELEAGLAWSHFFDSSGILKSSDASRTGGGLMSSSPSPRRGAARRTSKQPFPAVSAPSQQGLSPAAPPFLQQENLSPPAATLQQEGDFLDPENLASLIHPGEEKK